MWTQVRIFKDLCSQTEHIPTCVVSLDGAEAAENNKFHQTAYNILCLAVFPVQLYYSIKSREIWKFVVRNYIGFCCMSVGYWTEVMVEELSIIDRFQEFRDHAEGQGGKQVTENSNLSIKYNPLRMKDGAIEVILGGGTTTETSPEGGAKKVNSEEDIERKGFFVKYLSSMTSCRSVLWQLIPGMTAFAILSVDLSACPIFIFSPSIEENRLLPPLLVDNSWDIAKSQIKEGFIGGKPNGNPYYWQLALLSFYIFVQESRLIQFAVVVVNNLTAFAIVFGSSNLVAFVFLFLVVNLLVGYAQFGYTILLLHQFFFSANNSDQEDEYNQEDNTQPLIN